MKAKPGRPPLEVTRSVLIGARFTVQEAKEINRAVRHLANGKSEWIREVLLAAARSGAPIGPPVTPPGATPVVMGFDHGANGFLD